METDLVENTLVETLPNTEIKLYEEDEEVETKLDPRREKTWEYYISPRSSTFGNAKRSAMRGGFSESYSEQISAKVWWKAKKRKSKLLNNSEQITEKIFSLEAVNEDGKVDAAVLRVQADTAKHIQKTLGKDEGYSERVENVGSGNTIVFIPQELIEKFALDKPLEVDNRVV